MKEIHFEKIKLLAYDFDGVMTDNKALIDEFGNEKVFVNRSDGLAINIFRKLGYNQLIISTENSQIIVKRAKKLNIDFLVGVKDKLYEIKQYCEIRNLSLENTLYVGNDINDYEILKFAKISVVPLDANTFIKEIADIVLDKKGGEGCIRSLLDIFIDQEKQLKTFRM